MQPSPWPNATTIVCVASGPSLAREDLDKLRDCRIVAVSDAYKLCPFVDALYSAECKWWMWNEELALSAPVPLFTVSAIGKKRYPKLTQLIVTGAQGLEFREGRVRTGSHSGYTSVNLAVHLGAKRIILLGYDLQAGEDGRNHFFGEHRDGSHLRYGNHIKTYSALVPLLKPRGIEIVNATRRTAIPETSIPRASIEQLFPAGASV